MKGDRLAEIRYFRGDTQATLAEKLHVTHYTVSSWEQGKSTPREETLVEICRLYGVSADFLLGLSDTDPDFDRQQRQESLTSDEQADVRDYAEYLIWKRSRRAKNPRTDTK